MNKYTIPCTPEQTKKAFQLGAPIERHTGVTTAAAPEGYYLEVDTLVKIPTAEQMIGWIEEQESIGEVAIYSAINIETHWYYVLYNQAYCRCLRSITQYPSRKEATLAAIDAALEYLATNNLIK